MSLLRSAAVRRARRTVSGWLLRRRRAGATERRSGTRRLLVALLTSLVALLALFGAALAYPPDDGRELTLDQWGGLASEGRLVEARFLDAEATVTGGFSEGDGEPRGSGRYFLPYPSSDAVTAFLVETANGSGARVSIDPQPAKDVIVTVSTFLLPLMILANLFALLFSASRGGSSGIGEVMTFGTIGDKRRRRTAAAVTFDQVAGAHEAVTEESLVGVGAARVRDLFRRVRAVAPAMLFGAVVSGRRREVEPAPAVEGA